MANKNKKAFTLVELLAVIVILAVILVIAVPQIMNVINDSKKGVLESSARLIASSAESMKLSNDTLGIDREITCSDVAQLTSEDYETCKIDFINDEAYVSIVGKGKFEGMAVLSGTSEKAEAIITLGLELTDDGNMRYTGNNPSNYVEFGNDGELWRIIGIFNVTTADGKQEKLMKIVRDESIGKYSWDSSTGDGTSTGDNSGTHEEGEVNDGLGINQWGASTYTDGSAYEGADLMRELNTLYLDQRSGTCYNGINNATTTCNFSIVGIKDTYRGMIESVVWNTAGFTANASERTGHSAKTAYEAERGTMTGQICKGTTVKNGIQCTDIVKRTTTWEGRVGLIYLSDYGYASTNTSCRGYINDNTTNSCKNDNWLHNNTAYWTLSPFAHSVFSDRVWIPFPSGNTGDTHSALANNVRPSVYLKSNVSIISGEGTSNNPYRLGLNV